jgi:hypothetical protein
MNPENIKGPLDDYYKLMGIAPSKQTTGAAERDFNENDEAASKLFLVAHCAKRITRLLKSTSELGRLGSMPFVKEHLHRVGVYGTLGQWVEIASLSSNLAVSVTNGGVGSHQQDIARITSVLEMLKPDFQANPDTMRELYGFFDVLTGGSELRAFDIEGELPAG